MSDDGELLRNYVEQNSEQAFAELVNRHLGLVYHAALRQTGGNAHRAQDVAQTVFVDLARKAKSLSHRAVLSGWLYTSTRYAASKLARSEQRRQAREEGAQLMNELSSDSSSSSDWKQLRTLIDDALHALSERDREAVLLRFFEGKPFAEIGARLSVSEDAARVRVDRALDKLRTSLSRRGLSSTSIALATLLANEAMGSAPPGLAVKITGTALAGAAATGGSLAAAGTFLGLTQLQFGLAACVVLGGGGFVLHQQRQEIALRSEITELRGQQNQLVTLRQQDEQRPLVNRTAPRSRIQASATELSQAHAELAFLQEKKAEVDADQAALAAKKTPSEAVSAEETSEPRIYRPSELDQRPVPIEMAAPEMTLELRREGGGATVEFIIDPTGTPRNLKVLNTSSPEFGRRALAATMKWKFSPGVTKGKPVATRMTLPFRMNAEEPESSASSGAKKSNQETLPAANDDLHADVTPPGEKQEADVTPSSVPSTEAPTARIYLPRELDQRPLPLSMVEPELTPQLRLEGGTATVEFVVDATGMPRDFKILKASNPEFGRCAMEATVKWKFKPGVAKGKAVATRLTVPFRMNAETSNASTSTKTETPRNTPRLSSSPRESSNKSSEEAPSGPVVRTSDVGEPPYALSMMEPEFGPTLRKEGETHGFAATVEFIVDPAGTPRDLRLTESSSPAFGRSAMTAVSKWKFKPRFVDGKPVSAPLTIAFRMPKESLKATGATDPVSSEKLPEEETSTRPGYTVTALIDSTGLPHDLKIARNSDSAFGRSTGLTETKGIEPTP